MTHPAPGIVTATQLLSHVHMASVQTKFFGELEYSEDALFHFPAGLPGFENQHSFVFLQMPNSAPLMFLQSLTSPNLCFVLLPIMVVDPEYKLELSPEDLMTLGLPPDRQPAISKDILCAAIICAAESQTPTANLLAPVVVNLATKAGMQVINSEFGYSHCHRLQLAEAVAPC